MTTWRVLCEESSNVLFVGNWGQRWPSIGACQTVIPRQSSTNFPWKFGVQWTTILWWKVFAQPGNWTRDLLIYAQMLYRWATGLGWIYKEQLSKMHCFCVSCRSGKPLRVMQLTLASSHMWPLSRQKCTWGDCPLRVMHTAQEDYVQSPVHRVWCIGAQAFEISNTHSPVYWLWNQRHNYPLLLPLKSETHSPSPSVPLKSEASGVSVFRDPSQIS